MLPGPAYHVNMVDLKDPAGLADPALRDAIEALYFGYRAFTRGPDSLLARRGLGRVHHRILYFVGRQPGIKVNELLAVLAVSKQALNTPLRRLIELGLIDSRPGREDRRVRHLSLSASGKRLEATLSGTQTELLAAVFARCGRSAQRHWLQVMHALHDQQTGD